MVWPSSTSCTAGATPRLQRRWGSTKGRSRVASRLGIFWDSFSPDEFIGDVMTRITMMGAVLVLLAAVMPVNAQGYGPGVNPSNPQDLSHRTNPQDLTAPGGSNPQDLVRQPPAAASSVVTSPKPQSGVMLTATRHYKSAKTKQTRVPRHVHHHVHTPAASRTRIIVRHHYAGLKGLGPEDFCGGRLPAYGYDACGFPEVSYGLDSCLRRLPYRPWAGPEPRIVNVCR
jgi:hypothetical protein